jgi:hypothetical protein
MAKNKPNIAFLEALQHEKKKRGEQNKPGGGFRTPEWFFNKPKSPGAANDIGLGIGTMASQRFRISPGHIVVAVAILVILIGVAVYLSGGGRKPINSAPTEVIKNGLVQSGGMDVAAGGTAPVVPPGPAQSPVSVAPPAATETEAGLMAGHETRTVGLNYVIIQSYKDAKTATEAVEALRKAGIGCTIEKNLPYAPGWHVVLGTTGFVRANTPEYKEYTRKIMAVSEKFASVPGAGKWRKFEPNAYKWR